jgi:hypothetical protein
MPSHIYPEAKEDFLKADIDLDTATVKAVLVSAGYVYSDAHEFLSALGGNTVGTEVTVPGVTVADGTIDTSATELTFTAVPAGPAAVAVVFYVDTGDPATSHLLVYDDTPDVTPDGGDIIYSVNAAGIATI